MKLTFHTDYALRMLIFLGTHDGRQLTVADVAKAYGLSRNHLLKVALNLGRLGYVTTTRGRSGGISVTAANRTPSAAARERVSSLQNRWPVVAAVTETSFQSASSDMMSPMAGKVVPDRRRLSAASYLASGVRACPMSAAPAGGRRPGQDVRPPARTPRPAGGTIASFRRRP